MKRLLLLPGTQLILLAALLVCVSYTEVFTQTLETNLPITNANSEIYATVYNNNTIYIGGDFTYVGPKTGSGVAINNVTGIAMPDFPYVNGVIYAVASDESGGWYIGGNFTLVGGMARKNIAHIKADKSVDFNWDPQANNDVYAIVVSPDGNTVYVGGTFRISYGSPSIGGGDRDNIAALNATDGSATTWNPGANDGVFAIAVSPDGLTIYVGGGFTFFGNSDRNRIASINISSNTATVWNPSADQTVKVLEVSTDGSTVYAGGEFSTIGGQTRNFIAALNSSDGNATGWNPNADSYVYALALSGSTIYAGGNFNNIGGQLRNYVAELNNTTGEATSWNPNANNYVNAIYLSGSTIYVGGNFTTIGGELRNRIAALSTSTGLADVWDPNIGSTVNTIGIYGSMVFVGGNFNSCGGQNRNSIAAIDATTGNVKTWNPNIYFEGGGGNINSMAISADGQTIYVGGYFNKVGALDRNNIAAINVTDGAATSWDPNASDVVNAITVSGTTIYVGGQFYNGGTPGITIGGEDRNYIAAINATDGKATSWNPNANGNVFVLAISGSTIYAGGDFNDGGSPGTQTIGGEDRNYIAAIDLTTGNATSWNPNANGNVKALAISGTTIYVGGGFNDGDTPGGITIGGQVRNNIAAIDLSTGNATSWNPNANGPVYTLAIAGTTIYVGGGFSDDGDDQILTIGDENRNYIAAIDLTTGNATSWNPNANSTVYAIALSFTNEKIYIGGNFSSISGSDNYSFAGMDDLNNSALPVEVTSFNASIAKSEVNLAWQTATEVNNYGFEIERSQTSNVKSETWEKIGFVQGHGNSNSPKNYSYTDAQLNNSTSIQYRLKQIDFDGKFEYSNSIEVVLQTPVSFALNQNFPNPFNPTTVISFQVPIASKVMLKIYDIMGNEVAELVNGEKPAGNYDVIFNGHNLASGVYFYQLHAGSFIETKKLILMK